MADTRAPCESLEKAEDSTTLVTPSPRRKAPCPGGGGGGGGGEPGLDLGGALSSPVP